MSKKLKVGIVGAAGRMGINLIKSCLEPQFKENLELTSGLVLKDSEEDNKDLGSIAQINEINKEATSDIDNFINNVDAIIDFSSVNSTLNLLNKIKDLPKDSRPIVVIGTTGFSFEDEKTLQEFGKDIKILWSTNMSIGVHILNKLAEQTARTLGTEYDIEIIEAHHKNKVDAPSGTALTLGKFAAKGRNIDFEKVAVKSREGITGKRKEGEIGFSTIRAGQIIGDHKIIFASDHDIIEISHKSSSRQIYSNGAVKALIWLSKQKENKLYNFEEYVDSF